MGGVIGVVMLGMLMVVAGDAREMCGCVGRFAALNLIGSRGQEVDVQRVLI